MWEGGQPWGSVKHAEIKPPLVPNNQSAGGDMVKPHTNADLRSCRDRCKQSISVAAG